jgi:2-oxoglutarate dehydrogenase E1 component
LALCAEDNVRVCSPTTASQYFHLLRRQVRDAKRIPLVVMTPKSMLRDSRAYSRPQELADGQFELILVVPAVQDRQSIRRVLLCTGKVCYDLLAEQQRRQDLSVAIIRLEQLYPFPEWNLSKSLGNFDRAREIFWVQEEPQNMGAWSFVNRHIAHNIRFGRAFRYIGRPESASPASGLLKTYRKEQEAIVAAAFD